MRNPLARRLTQKHICAMGVIRTSGGCGGSPMTSRLVGTNADTAVWSSTRRVDDPTRGLQTPAWRRGCELYPLGYNWIDAASVFPRRFAEVSAKLPGGRAA